MDKETLVEKLDDGKRLLRLLASDEFDVKVAFWARTTEGDLWRLYIASSSVDARNLSGALRIVYGALSRIPDCSVVPSEITLLPESDPIARDASVLQYKKLGAERFRDIQLGNLLVADLFLYPPLQLMKPEPVMKESCFVVMAISDQSTNGNVTTAESLKDTYSNVIREALSQARPGLEIQRSDEVSEPGTITTDILTRLMHSKFVIVDITFPNSNVFYELGIRHACRSGTVLIRDAESEHKVAFDVSHQRYIEYRKTPAGIKQLSADFRKAFHWFDSNPDQADNQLLALAKLTHFNFPQFGKEVQDKAVDNAADLFAMFLTNPDLLASISDRTLSPDERQKRIIQAMAINPEHAKKMLKLFFSLGAFGDKLLP